MKDERLFWGDLHPVCVLRGLLYNLWVLILAVLTAWLCVEGYHLFTYHPVYTASATVAVNVKGGTSAYTSLDFTARMAQVFASVFQSDTFREAAQCDVEASVLPETNLINVQVTAENPRESFLSLKNVLENHADLTDELFSNAELRVIRDPQVPLAPSNPVDLKPYRMRACVGAMLAASLIVSVLFLLFKLFQKKIQKFMHFSLYIVINSTANHKTTCKANCTTKALLYRLFIFIT